MLRRFGSHRLWAHCRLKAIVQPRTSTATVQRQLGTLPTIGAKHTRIAGVSRQILSGEPRRCWVAGQPTLWTYVPRQSMSASAQPAVAGAVTREDRKGDQSWKRRRNARTGPGDRNRQSNTRKGGRKQHNRGARNSPGQKQRSTPKSIPRIFTHPRRIMVDYSGLITARAEEYQQTTDEPWTPQIQKYIECSGTITEFPLLSDEAAVAGSSDSTVSDPQQEQTSEEVEDGRSSSSLAVEPPVLPDSTRWMRDLGTLRFRNASQTEIRQHEDTYYAPLTRLLYKAVEKGDVAPLMELLKPLSNRSYRIPYKVMDAINCAIVTTPTPESVVGVLQHVVMQNPGAVRPLQLCYAMDAIGSIQRKDLLDALLFACMHSPQLLGSTASQKVLLLKYLQQVDKLTRNVGTFVDKLLELQLSHYPYPVDGPVAPRTACGVAAFNDQTNVQSSVGGGQERYQLNSQMEELRAQAQASVPKFGPDNPMFMPVIPFTLSELLPRPVVNLYPETLAEVYLSAFAAVADTDSLPRLWERTRPFLRSFSKDAAVIFAQIVSRTLTTVKTGAEASARYKHQSMLAEDMGYLVTRPDLFRERAIVSAVMTSLREYHKSFHLSRSVLGAHINYAAANKLPLFHNAVLPAVFFAFDLRTAMRVMNLMEQGEEVPLKLRETDDQQLALTPMLDLSKRDPQLAATCLQQSLTRMQISGNTNNAPLALKLMAVVKDYPNHRMLSSLGAICSSRSRGLLWMQIVQALPHSEGMRKHWDSKYTTTVLSTFSSLHQFHHIGALISYLCRDRIVDPVARQTFFSALPRALGLGSFTSARAVQYLETANLKEVAEMMDGNPDALLPVLSIALESAKYTPTWQQRRLIPVVEDLRVSNSLHTTLAYIRALFAAGGSAELPSVQLQALAMDRSLLTPDAREMMTTFAADSIKQCRWSDLKALFELMTERERSWSEQALPKLKESVDALQTVQQVDELRDALQQHESLFDGECEELIHHANQRLRAVKAGSRRA